MTLPEPGAPFITTERLEVSIPTRDDIPGLLAIVAQPETHRYLGPMGTTSTHLSRTLRHIGSWLVYGYGLCVVKRRGERDPIGNCAIFRGHRDLGPDFDDRPEAGWIIHADHVGQGVASEAMQALLHWFDTAHGREVVCLIDPENAASLRLADKLGFAHLRDAIMPGSDERVVLLRRPPAEG